MRENKINKINIEEFLLIDEEIFLLNFEEISAKKGIKIIGERP